VQAQPNALGAPFFSGQGIFAQGWYRDPSAPNQTNLSNALSFAMCMGAGDTTPPTITTCAANQTVGTLVGCLGVVPNLKNSVVASDNCSGATITQSPAAGATVGLGVNVITFTATDAAGNSSQCFSTLTVTDTAAPVIAYCAPNQTVSANSSCQAVVPDFTARAVVVDACGGSVTLSQSPLAGTLTSVGVQSVPVTITATDTVGNTSSCVATLTVTQTALCLIPSGFVPIPPGTFQMGSNAATGAPYYNEVGSSPQPVHAVTISYPFWMGAKEVTQAEYETLMGTNPSGFVGNLSHPVEQVSWNNARSYCAALTAQQAALGAVPSGYEYRLPTEAEWEYACRAGTTTEFNVGASLFCNQARFAYSLHSSSNCNNSSYGTGPVGSYAPNAWGLYDMHGNVWEWCLDSVANYPAGAVTDPFATGGPARVLRGGSWEIDSSLCRSAMRGSYYPHLTFIFNGFRVVLAPVLVP
jgi:formylglycine-generating enzyme required for sulfatase activity